MGPLHGVKIIEIASLAPAPMGTTVLADLGAEVILIDRPGGTKGGAATGDGNPVRRNRKSITLDLKKPEAREILLKLCDQADVFVEGFRPGVTERLGLGPDDLAARNPRIVYARMTGWGQTGPLAQTAGHDMNYIAISGALHGLGQDRERPHFPSNLLGDFGGGSTYLVIGVLAFLMRTFDYPLAPLIIGMVLGPLAEYSLRDAMQSADGDASVLVSSPIAIGLYVVLLLVLGLTIRAKLAGRAGARA